MGFQVHSHHQIQLFSSLTLNSVLIYQPRPRGVSDDYPSGPQSFDFLQNRTVLPPHPVDENRHLFLGWGLGLTELTQAGILPLSSAARCPLLVGHTHLSILNTRHDRELLPQAHGTRSAPQTRGRGDLSPTSIRCAHSALEPLLPPLLGTSTRGSVFK